MRRKMYFKQSSQFLTRTTRETSSSSGTKRET